MKEEVLCELCRKPMRQIGSFATRKVEGQPSEKWDGKLKFQCLDEDCNRYQEIIEINDSNLESYQKRVQKLCECGHDRYMHDHRFSQFENGEPIPQGKKDVECLANNCSCTQYIVKK